MKLWRKLCKNKNPFFITHFLRHCEERSDEAIHLFVGNGLPHHFVLRNDNRGKQLLLFFILLLSVSVAKAAFNQQDRQQFIQFLAQKISHQNEQVATERKHLQYLYRRWQAGHHLKRTQHKWLQHLASRYKAKWPQTLVQADWQRLLRQVDLIPAALVIAQAINESNWGRSRFAKSGRNYFGQWCYCKGCGLVPLQRDAGATHEVTKFSSAQASIAAYFRNINSNRVYRKLWELRSQQRQRQQTLSSEILARGLINYSQRHAAYVTSIRQLIKRYQLDRFDRG